jgi:hypothetical protein
MNEPRRLSQSGGISQRLLDSASIDKPSEAARRRAEMFAGTASSFSTTATPSGVRRKGGNTAKTLVTWAFIGAAASGALAFFGSRWLDGGTAAAPSAGVPMAEIPAPRAAARPSDIAAEPGAPATGAAATASPEEAREIASARAAVGRGDNKAALSTLDQYDRAYPTGTLRGESTLLRVQALNNSGQTTEAKRVVEEFTEKNPNHPMTQQLRGLGK